MQDGRQAIEAIERKFPDAVVGTGSYRDQHWLELDPQALIEVARFLRDDAGTDYDYLVDVTGVHWPDDPRPMELVYHLFSTARNDRLRLKVRVPDFGPAPSLSELWRSAAWNEREVFDMFGLRFAGHPNLTRILMPEEYTDHPLRKELPLYRG